MSRIGKKQVNKHITGKNNPNWRGGRITDKDGYIMIYKPSHPFCSASGDVREHRLVMECKIGRFLTKNEVVHHKNANVGDNRIENLELLSKQEHDKLEYNKRGGIKKI